jgi:hypothetical protein
MVRNNYIEPNKVTLTRWMDTTLDQSLFLKNIKSGFKVMGIRPLNPKAMNEKLGLA